MDFDSASSRAITRPDENTMRFGNVDIDIPSVYEAVEEGGYLPRNMCYAVCESLLCPVCGRLIDVCLPMSINNIELTYYPYIDLDICERLRSDDTESEVEYFLGVLDLTLRCDDHRVDNITYGYSLGCAECDAYPNSLEGIKEELANPNTLILNGKKCKELASLKMQ